MENTEQIEAIACTTARAGAVAFFEKERGRGKPLSADYVAMTIAEDIGMAFYNAGYSYHALDSERRMKIARTALRDVGYPGLAGEVQ